MAKFKKGEAPPKRKGKRLSYKAAVVAKCKECIYDPIDKGTWLAQVTECSSPTCPLYEVRPTNKKGSS